MSKKVKEQVSEVKKVKEEKQVVESEIYLLIYQVSETEEKILSSYSYKEDILFLIDEFVKSQKLREKYNIVNPEKLKMISTSLEHNFELELPSSEIRKQELDKLFSDLDKSFSEMEK
tara:strand:- start:539 stop:889 length:351 start_codon:yes stop_codon:yes gene_type:complete